MALQEQQLGQTTSQTAVASSIYSPGASETCIVRTIYVTNLTAGNLTFSIFCDNDGSTYNEFTALFWKSNIGANTTQEINTFIAMNNASGNLAVSASAVNSITFTAFGGVIS